MCSSTKIRSSIPTLRTLCSAPTSTLKIIPTIDTIKEMKTKKIAVALLLLAVVVTLGACKKSRFCHCISESYTTVTPDSVRHTVADTVVVNVDRSFKCNHLLELGIQELKNGEYVTSTRKVDCVELDVDNVTTIPQEHPTD